MAVGKLIRSAEHLAREHTERAIETIANVMDDWTAEDRDRIAAANALLDRGHGKPVNAVISVPASRQMQQALAAMTDAELEAEIMDQPLPRLSVDSPSSRGAPIQRGTVSDLHADSADLVPEGTEEPDPLTL